MKTKKVKVVILPTKEKSQICLNEYINETHNCSKIQFNKEPKFSYEDAKSMGFNYQHLYLLSDEEIKEGDWFIEQTGLGWYKPSKMEGKYLENKDFIRRCYKIIATTDIKLYTNEMVEEDMHMYKKSLPQPPQAFIEKYCKVDGIDEVLVEYETVNINHGTDFPHRYETNIKTDSHNTITIYPIKDSWSREELIDKINNAVWELGSGMGVNQDSIDKWIKENL